MKKYKVKISLEREVEANDEYEACENFWQELAEDNAIENTTTENRLVESMEIKENKK